MFLAITYLPRFSSSCSAWNTGWWVVSIGYNHRHQFSLHPGSRWCSNHRQWNVWARNLCL